MYVCIKMCACTTCWVRRCAGFINGEKGTVCTSPKVHQHMHIHDLLTCVCTVCVMNVVMYYMYIT